MSLRSNAPGGAQSSFVVSYVTPGKRLACQSRASFNGAHNLAKQLRRKRCSSIGIEDKASGREVYYLA